MFIAQVSLGQAESTPRAIAGFGFQADISRVCVPHSRICIPELCVFIASGGRLVYEGKIENRLSGAELLKSSQKKMFKMAACLQNAVRVLAVLSLPLLP